MKFSIQSEIRFYLDTYGYSLVDDNKLITSDMIRKEISSFFSNTKFGRKWLNFWLRFIPWYYVVTKNIRIYRNEEYPIIIFVENILFSVKKEGVNLNTISLPGQFFIPTHIYNKSLYSNMSLHLASIAVICDWLPQCLKKTQRRDKLEELGI